MNHCLGFTFKANNSIVCIEIDNQIGRGFGLVYLLNKYSLISA